MREWPHWLPAKRCPLPEYIPDVTGGHASPIALTAWKIKAIRLMILLDRRGFVTRQDMNALQISAARWTDGYHGFLARDPGRGGYVRCDRTPHLRAQHPVNFAQIEADFAKWGAGFDVTPAPAQGALFEGAAALTYHVYGSEGAYTAQTVIDDPAMPTITPTSILDHRGDMLVRVRTPARVQMGVKAGASAAQAAPSSCPNAWWCADETIHRLALQGLAEVFDPAGVKWRVQQGGNTPAS